MGVHRPTLSPESINAVKSGGKVLIIGGMARNYADSIKDNPQIEIWETSELREGSINSIPEDVRLIVVSRFVKHKVVERIDSVRPDGVGMLTVPYPTGQMSELMRKLEVPGFVPVVKEGEGAPKRIPKSWFDSFFAESADWDTDPQTELPRLTSLAKARGVDSATLLKRWYGAARKKHLKSKESVPSVRTVVEEVGVPEVAKTPIDARSLKLIKDLKALFQAALSEIESVEKEYEG